MRTLWFAHRDYSVATFKRYSFLNQMGRPPVFSDCSGFLVDIRLKRHPSDKECRYGACGGSTQPVKDTTRIYAIVVPILCGWRKRNQEIFMLLFVVMRYAAQITDSQVVWIGS